MKAFQWMTCLSLTTLLLATACSGGDEETGPVCSADALNDCECTSGEAGQQACADDGSHWLDCVCDGTPPPDAGNNPDTGSTPDIVSTPDTTQPDTGSTPDTILPPPVDTGTTPPTGNNQCEVDADCEAPGKCSQDAVMGCKCMTNQQGVKRCMPLCETTEDCPTPKNPEITLGCNPNGVCTKKAGEQQNPDPPEGNTTVLANCTSQADCDADGGCPSDAPKGCSCITNINGNQKCVPLCEEDGDCPTSLSMDMICGIQQGHCVPDNGNTGRVPGSNP